MKIAFLHMTMGLTDRGAEVSTEILAAELAKKQTVLVLQSGPVHKKPYQVKRIWPLKTVPKTAPQNAWDKLRFRIYLDEGSGQIRAFTRAALTALAAFAPDIIVATNGAPQLQVLRSHNLRAKIVVFGRAGIGYHDRDNLRQSPDLFVALSPSAATWAARHKTKSTKIRMIPNPINVREYQTVKPTNLALPEPVVMTVAALSRYKNIDQVVQAVKAIPVSLLLIGDGEEHDVIAKQLTTLANDFRWIHHVEPHELPGYYAAAHVFCFIPDAQEAFGRVYLEAMAAGLPIVASDDPIRHQIIGKNGIFVDPHNPTHIAEGIVQGIHLGKVDYTQELEPYRVKTVIQAIEKEFYALIS